MEGVVQSTLRGSRCSSLSLLWTQAFRGMHRTPIHCACQLSKRGSACFACRSMLPEASSWSTNLLMSVSTSSHHQVLILWLWMKLGSKNPSILWFLLNDFWFGACCSILPCEGWHLCKMVMLSFGWASCWICSFSLSLNCHDLNLLCSAQEPLPTSPFLNVFDFFWQHFVAFYIQVLSKTC